MVLVLVPSLQMCHHCCCASHSLQRQLVCCSLAPKLPQHHQTKLSTGTLRARSNSSNCWQSVCTLSLCCLICDLIAALHLFLIGYRRLLVPLRPTRLLLLVQLLITSCCSWRSHKQRNTINPLPHSHARCCAGIRYICCCSRSNMASSMALLRTAVRGVATARGFSTSAAAAAKVRYLYMCVDDGSFGCAVPSARCTPHTHDCRWRLLVWATWASRWPPTC